MKKKSPKKPKEKEMLNLAMPKGKMPKSMKKGFKK